MQINDRDKADLLAAFQNNQGAPPAVLVDIVATLMTKRMRFSPTDSETLEWAKRRLTAKAVAITYGVSQVTAGKALKARARALGYRRGGEKGLVGLQDYHDDILGVNVI